MGGLYYICAFTIAFGFSTGSQIVIGRRNGEGRYGQIGPVMWQGIFFLLFLATILFLFSRWFAKDVMRLLISSDAILEATDAFLDWRVFGFFFSFLSVMFRAFFIGITRTKVLTLNAVCMAMTNVLLDYLLGAMQRSGKLPEKPVALKTIVTTEMAKAVAESYGAACYDTFTGFKFLAEKKDKLEGSGEGKVVFSYEESYGYMLGDFVRDKDAVTASLALTEMAAYYAGKGMTVLDALNALYAKHGYYGEKTHNLVMPGLDGLRDMANLMASLRRTPPREISGVAVRQFKDYQDGSVTDCSTGEKSVMELSGSNVLRFELSDGTSIIVRPSGTEPKIKVYVLTKGSDAAERDANLAKYAAWVAGLKK